MIQILAGIAAFYAACCVFAVAFEGATMQIKQPGDLAENVAIGAIIVGLVLNILLDVGIIVASLSTL